MDSFLKSCGASQVPLLKIQGSIQEEYHLSRAFAMVGRSDLCDLQLDNPQISPKHAYLQVIQGHLACFDLSTHSGIQWQNGRPSRSGWVETGQSFGIGPFTLNRADKFRCPGIELGAAPLKFDWNELGPDVFLDFPDETSRTVRWQVRRGVTLVGRASSCRVRLPDMSVSWFHCSLVRTTDGLWVVDLMSREGTIVNGVGQRCTRLENGDELEIGRFRIVPRYLHSNKSGQTTVHNTNSGPETTSTSKIHGNTLSPIQLPQSLATANPYNPIEHNKSIMRTEILDIIGAGAPETVSPGLMLLVEKFGNMQQQMLEQFSQTMMMMMMNMGESYRTEISQVRAEVDRLRELSHELISLQAKVLRAEPESLSQPKLADTSTDSQQSPVPVPEQNLSQPTRPQVKGITPPPINLGKTIGASQAPSESQTLGDDPLVTVTRRISEIRSEQKGRWQTILDIVKLR